MPERTLSSQPAYGKTMCALLIDALSHNYRYDMLHRYDPKYLEHFIYFTPPEKDIAITEKENLYSLFKVKSDVELRKKIFVEFLREAEDKVLTRDYFGYWMYNRDDLIAMYKGSYDDAPKILTPTKGYSSVRQYCADQLKLEAKEAMQKRVAVQAEDQRGVGAEIGGEAVPRIDIQLEVANQKQALDDAIDFALAGSKTKEQKTFHYSGEKKNFLDPCSPNPITSFLYRSTKKTHCFLGGWTASATGVIFLTLAIMSGGALLPIFITLSVTSFGAGITFFYAFHKIQSRVPVYYQCDGAEYSNDDNKEVENLLVLNQNEEITEEKSAQQLTQLKTDTVRTIHLLKDDVRFSKKNDPGIKVKDELNATSIERAQRTVERVKDSLGP